jgi:hypothetical protein
MADTKRPRFKLAATQAPGGDPFMTVDYDLPYFIEVPILLQPGHVLIYSHGRLYYDGIELLSRFDCERLDEEA